MEVTTTGRPDARAKNWLREHRSLPQRIEDGEQVAALVKQPGWDVICDLALGMKVANDKALDTVAHKTALNADIQARIDFALKKGFADALAMVPDLAASVLDSAKKAADELRKTAALDEAAGRN